MTDPQLYPVEMSSLQSLVPVLSPCLPYSLSILSNPIFFQAVAKKKKECIDAPDPMKIGYAESEKGYQILRLTAPLSCVHVIGLIDGSIRINHTIHLRMLDAHW
jgi:hypothetical protein